MPQIDTGGLLKNPLGATSSFANKKLDQSMEKIKSLGSAKAKEALDKIGIPFDRIEKLEKCSALARGYVSRVRNYGLESVADFASKASNVQTYMNRLGLNNCDIAGKVFGFANQAGKFLCDQLGIEISSIDGMLSKIQGYVDMASDYLDEAIRRAEAFVGEIDKFIDSTIAKVTQIGKDIIEGIESELKEYAKIIQANAQAHLGKILGEFLNDPCIKNMTNNLVTEAGRSVKKKAKMAL